MAEEKKQTEKTGQEAAEQEAAKKPEADAAAAEKVEEPAAEPQKELSAEEKLQAEVESLKKELADEKEKYLRLDAEYYNYRTRSIKEKQEAYDNALCKTVTEVLNFERAANAECSDENFKKGVDMIFKQYLAILEKLGVSEIPAQGQPFDPNLHNAVSSCEDENLGENTVAAVLQKGYTLGKKVIRHAMVTVANP